MGYSAPVEGLTKHLQGKLSPRVLGDFAFLSPSSGLQS